jgi:hypothetical protein
MAGAAVTMTAEQASPDEILAGQNLGQVPDDDQRLQSHVFTAAIRRDLGTVPPFIRLVRA